MSYRDGWRHVDGWSERVLDYIAATEREWVGRGPGEWLPARPHAGQPTGGCSMIPTGR
ncbi:MAG: hypothetical protein HY321_19045 [Armatimonadetes bacterium]|nr:hypothetical protein [Armatimonadota bacterium]